MARSKATPFKGSKFSIQTGTDDPAAIQGISAAAPAVVSQTTHGYVNGDVVAITGVNEEIDGAYAITVLSDNTYSLKDTDFVGLDVTIGTASEASVVVFTSACELTAINKTGGTIDQTEVSTICSDRKEYESGLADSGTLQLSFNYAPATSVQQQLEQYELNAEKFWSKLELPRNQGTLLFYGAIQTGMNIDGAVNGVYTSGVTIQLSGNYYRIPAVTSGSGL